MSYPFSIRPPADQDVVFGDPLPPVAPSWGIYAHLQLLIPDIGAWDEVGVRVRVDEVNGYAEIQARLPRALPQATIQQLTDFFPQRIEYTDIDRQWDRDLGHPTDDWEKASTFAKMVGDYVEYAHDKLRAAAWAHACGKPWTG
ncbi:hypothetical protein HDC37_001836 [Microbacterium sp. AK009]|uniref:hypothetical protein n=1 Tax=Microbacterium sp. AK009 TaxID=2723068 RepID=UPI0015CA6911|nr:hypothetical protein [Microbacterium sp. AK009]NYF17008.1 hypothetical protein [Microbacterium sp. AK009]